MDLIVIVVMIYCIGLVIAPILIRMLPGLNEYLHKSLNTRNPAVFSIILWPTILACLFIYCTYKLMVSLLNWVSGNGFITQSNEDYIKWGLN